MLANKSMPAFIRHIGIDYSGAQTPTASLKGLRVYLAEAGFPPVEVPPAPSPRKYWTRRGIAEWLVERLAENAVTLVGIDHGFSFPLRYFEVHGLAPDWPAFLDDFQRHWPTDDDNTYVDFVRQGAAGEGGRRSAFTPIPPQGLPDHGQGNASDRAWPTRPWASRSRLSGWSSSHVTTIFRIRRMVTEIGRQVR